jgi:hypothetical protein
MYVLDYMRSDLFIDGLHVSSRCWFLVSEQVDSYRMDRVISDEDIIVDKMIAASQKKGETALPSYGRNFVPYFVPGASNPGEHDINVNTDIDNFRR